MPPPCPSKELGLTLQPDTGASASYVLFVLSRHVFSGLCGRGCPIQILPLLISPQDETGEEGVLVMPEKDRKKVKVGTKVSADKLRSAEHEGTDQMKAAHERLKDQTQLAANSQALVSAICVWGVRGTATV